MNNYKTKIEIKKGQLEAYELMFGYGEDELTKYGIPRLDNIKTWTGMFDDGCQVDVKINSSEDDVWSEAVLFDKEGNELSHTEVCDSLAGKWVFTIDDDTYEVDVVGVE